MTKTFITLKKLPDMDQARKLKRFLNENDIKCFLSDNISTVDNNFLDPLSTDVEAKIKSEDYDKASKLVEKWIEKMLDEFDRNYKIFSFSDRRLYTILLKPENWTEFDYRLAKRLLIEKGKPVDEDFVNSLRKENRVKQRNRKIRLTVSYMLTALSSFAKIPNTAKKELSGSIEIYSHTGLKET